MSKLLQAQFLWMVFLLSACGVNGEFLKPASFQDGVAAAYTTVDGLAEATLLMGQTGVITKGDGANVYAQLKNLKEGVDLAVVLYRTDPTSAESRLTATRKALEGLDDYLKSRRPKQ